MITKLLSTVKQVRFEDHNGKVIGRIERDKRGICKLIGQKPDYAHWQVVAYFNPARAEDKTFITPQPRQDLVG